LFASLVTDIVLPGLLLSFAIRYDWSKRLVRENDGGGSDDEKISKDRRRGGGYYVWICFGYAVGLMMANIAVYAMKMGQPALLYLVPCTLGVMVWLGWRRGELGEMFNGPKIMDQAAAILDAIEDERGGAEGAGGEGEGSEAGEGDGIGLLNSRV